MGDTTSWGPSPARNLQYPKCRWSEAEHQALLSRIPESSRLHHLYEPDSEEEYDAEEEESVYIDYEERYPGACLLELKTMPDDIMKLVVRLRDGGVTAATARKLVQFTLCTCYTTDRADATLLQLQTLLQITPSKGLRFNE